MPQSLNSVIVHIVFSTKDRLPIITEEWLSPLHGYLATVARNMGCPCCRVGGVADHVHLAVNLSRTVTIAGLVEPLKTSSSKWLKSQSPRLCDFAWQRGYGAFSIGRRDVDSLISYIDRQAEHHRTKTFQEEYLEMLEEFGIEYDLRYLWD
jgi:REP element-mobilizing transposase RayT